MKTTDAKTLLREIEYNAKSAVPGTETLTFCAEPYSWLCLTSAAHRGLEALTLIEQRNAAYEERNRLVAALSCLFPASLERHPADDKTWEDDWRWIVFIDLPCGQATWHIHDSHLHLFEHLPRNKGRIWDGHTTERKYERLSNLASLVSGAQFVAPTKQRQEG